MKEDCRFIRARQPAQIAQRRTQIVTAAAELLAEHGLEKVSLNGIARRAGVAKSNIYRYFESREDIYLQLLREDVQQWINAVELKLEPLVGSDRVDQVAKLLAQQLVAAPRLCQLISVVSAVLEQNLSETVLLNFKLDFVQMGLRLVRAVQSALPGMHPENLLPVAHSIIALIAGLWPLGNPSPVVEKVMAKPELRAFKVTFDSTIERALRLMLQGAYTL